MNDRLTRMLASVKPPVQPTIQKKAETMDQVLDQAIVDAKKLEKTASIPAPPAQTQFVNADVGQLLTEQIAHEFKNQYEYLAVSAFFKKVGLDGFSNYFTKQASEEAGHAAKIIAYLMESGTEFRMPAIEAPAAVLTTARHAAEHYLTLEKGTTLQWLNIFRNADKTDDYPVIKLAQWFVDEQISEEDEAVTFYQKVAIAGEGAGLLILDQEYAKR